MKVTLVYGMYDKPLLLIKIKWCLAEKMRLARWAKHEDKHNQALMDGLLACKGYFQAILVHPLFKKFSASLKEKINNNAKELSRLCASMMLLAVMEEETSCSITYQIPCEEDLRAMKGLCAGSKDDQEQRLKKMINVLHEHVDASQIFTTKTPIVEFWVDRLPWQIVFQAIRSEEEEMALAAFNSIPEDNLLLKALLKAHDKDYILSLIIACANLSETEPAEISQDVICGHLTFEIIINDLITTLEQRRKINICFGLPSHHANRKGAAGFCLINKLAVLMYYEQQLVATPPRIISIGTDVNRDDGLSMVEHFHIDIYDSRVYPWHTEEIISDQLKCNSERRDTVTIWSDKTRCYMSIDLATNLRGNSTHHPALLLALSEFEKQLANAAHNQEKVILFLPTGWDSHHQERARCGRWINQEYMLTPKESLQCRFTDNDLNYFNQQIMSLYERYQTTVTCLYWQLEGGYTDRVNATQIANLTAIIQQQAWLNPIQSDICHMSV